MPSPKSPNDAPPEDAYGALRVAPFRAFILVRFLMTVGVQIQAVAVASQIYKATNEPLALGLIGLAEAIPSIGVALFAGHTADIRSRKAIALWSLLVLCFCSLSLFLYATLTHQIMLTHRVLDARTLDVRPIYAIIFLSGIARGFLGPALGGMVAQIVPRELYANSVAWSSSVWQTAAIGGPALGGLIYGFFHPNEPFSGAREAFGADAFLMLLALGFMLTIPRTPVAPRAVQVSVRKSIGEGLRFVFSNQIVLGALALDLFAVLFGGAVALLPVFADEILHTGARGLGLLRAAPAVGAVLMSLFLAHNPLKSGVGRKLLLVVAGFGVAAICFAVSRNFALSLLFLAIGGAFDNVSVVIRSTLLQLHTPDEMRGRVSAVNNIFIGSSNEIGAFESGAMAHWIGTVPSVIFGGAMTMIVVGVTYFVAPKLRDLEKLSD